MVDGIAHQMHQWFEEAIYNRLVSLRAIALRHERDFFAKLA